MAKFLTELGLQRAVAPFLEPIVFEVSGELLIGVPACLQLTGGVDGNEPVQRPSLNGEVRHVARDSLTQYRPVRQVVGEG